MSSKVASPLLPNHPNWNWNFHFVVNVTTPADSQTIQTGIEIQQEHLHLKWLKTPKPSKLELKYPKTRSTLQMAIRLPNHPNWNWNILTILTHQHKSELPNHPNWNWNEIYVGATKEAQALPNHPNWNWNELIINKHSVKNNSQTIQTGIEIRLNLHQLHLVLASQTIQTGIEIIKRATQIIQ